MASCNLSGDSGKTHGTGGATTAALERLATVGTVTSPLATTK